MDRHAASGKPNAPQGTHRAAATVNGAAPLMVILK